MFSLLFLDFGQFGDERLGAGQMQGAVRRRSTVRRGAAQHRARVRRGRAFHANLCRVTRRFAALPLPRALDCTQFALRGTDCALGVRKSGVTMVDWE